MKKEVVEPTYEALKAELVDKDIFDPFYLCLLFHIFNMINFIF